MSLPQTLAMLVLEAKHAKLQKTASDVLAILTGLPFWTGPELPYVADWLRKRSAHLCQRSAQLAQAAELHARAANAIDAAARKAAA